MRLTIKNKFVIGVIVFAILYIFIALITFYNRNLILKSQRALVNLSMEMDRLTRLERGADKLLMPVHDYIITGEKDLANSFDAILNSEVAPILEELRAQPLIEENIRHLDMVGEGLSSLKGVAQEIFKIDKPAVKEAESSLMYKLDGIYREKILKHIEKLDDIDSAELRKAAKTALDVKKKMDLLIFAGLFSALLIGFISLPLIISAIIRPIRVLEKGANSIRKGNFVHIDLKTGDEFENLASAFNAMVVRLKKSYEGLEEKVRKRTMELEKRVDELERFRKATVKREFRIKELKDRVRELEAELEEARRNKA